MTIGLFGPNWAPRPILQTLVQVDCETGPTEIVPNWVPRPILQTLVQVDWEPGPSEIGPNWSPRPILQTLVQVDWEPGPSEIGPNWSPDLLRSAPAVTVLTWRSAALSKNVEVSTCTGFFAICTGLQAYDTILTDIYDFGETNIFSDLHEKWR